MAAHRTETGDPGSGERPLHLLPHVLRLEVPLDVDHGDVDHAQDEHPAPETGAAADYGLDRNTPGIIILSL